MPRRPILAAVATLSTLSLLTACNGSPEAGRPNTAPTSPAATPAATPTAPSTPPKPSEEQAAITAAKARYVAAWVAIDAALNNPPAASRDKLLQAGTGGNWLIQVWGNVGFNRKRGWYQDGKVKVESMTVTSVKTKGEQPEVNLSACLNSTKVTLRYLATHKPVPLGPGTSGRSKVQAKLVFAPPDGETKKMWFLIDQQDTGEC
ncbi:hypothetical protein ACWEOO_18650 [Kribbella sp. NPDC004138]